MKNLYVTIMILIALVKRYNKVINTIIEIIELVINLVKTAKINSTNKLLQVTAGLVATKLMENYLDEITSTIIDVVIILYKYEIVINIITAQVLVVLTQTLVLMVQLIQNSLAIFLQVKTAVYLNVFQLHFLVKVERCLIDGGAESIDSLPAWKSNWHNLYDLRRHVAQGKMFIHINSLCSHA